MFPNRTFVAWHILPLLLGCFDFAQAGVCQRWGDVTRIGKIESTILKEASGLTVSQKFSERLYWVNDSGDKGHLFISDLRGQNVESFRFEGKRPRDIEALTYGPCPEGHCVILGDIGDNDAKRHHIKISWIKEVEKFREPVAIVREMRVTYPDGPHNAEAMALLPNGDLIIVTKELRAKVNAGPAFVYKLAKNKIVSARNGTAVLEKLGSLPLPTWFQSDWPMGQVVTDMSVQPQREVFVLLTYNRGVEIPIANLTKLSSVNKWVVGTDYQFVPLRALAQQETIAYVGNRLIWSTELFPPEAPINALPCEL